eukprot:TRINITY_DN12493_c0_g1_i1.p1 TRINITY_DN12493_c0_g1~~TRINITY_DN12493_c0_g1_i1.p1  ORF type:complete len:288 (-),score=48.58 TRINITY_DN12493_c0_g1_i1:465-1253(-)
MAFVAVVSSMLPSAAGQMVCAVKGEALCGSAADFDLVRKPSFAKELTKAGMEAYMLKLSGADAIEMVLGKGTLSPGCVACQGTALDCGLKQRGCISLCVSSSCGAACRSCMHEQCSVEKACGGVPGVSVQPLYTCAQGDSDNDFTVDNDLVGLKFHGLCTSTFNASDIRTAHNIGTESSKHLVLQASGSGAAKSNNGSTAAGAALSLRESEGPTAQTATTTDSESSAAGQQAFLGATTRVAVSRMLPTVLFMSCVLTALREW